jgi:hypothetical protein
MRKLNLTEAKNTHMTHLEDSVFLDGVQGTRQAIDYVRQMRDTLNGHASRPITTSVKWDGAPAIFVGPHPETGKFFVAKKSLFNKTPLYYSSLAEIDQSTDIPQGLKSKFKLAYTYLKPLGIDQIIQGDFLYDATEVYAEKIDGEDLIMFHPNTIVYAFPKNTPIGKTIQRSKFGIVWHTTYSGTTIESLRASFGVKMPRSSSDIFQVDAMYSDVSGSASLTDKESRSLRNNLSMIGTAFQKTPPNAFASFTKVPELQALALVYCNSFVRNNTSIKPATAATGFVHYVIEYFKSKEDKLKTPRGKTAAKAKAQPVMRALTQIPKAQLTNIFQIYVLLQQSKNLLVMKLNSRGFGQTFLKTNDGYRVTGQEGFVAIDHLSGNAVKFVDRLEFSLANFDPKFIKGWQSNARR